jgi:hypothetical protein
MAANKAGTRDRRTESTTPAWIPALAGAGLAVVTVGAALVLLAIAGQENSGAPPVVQIPPAPQPPATLPAPPPTAAWWDDVPQSNLASTVAGIKQLSPADATVFTGLGEKNDTLRLAAYKKLVDKLPDLMSNPAVKDQLGRLLADCYAWEPVAQNVAGLREWIIRQVPRKDAEFPADYKSEDLEQARWALDVGVNALTHPKTQLNQLKPLVQEFQTTFGVVMEPSAPPLELRARAEKLLALRCYANLAPTAGKSVERAVAIRELLVKKFPQYLSPTFREKIDIEIAFNGLPGASTSWPAYSVLLRNCLDSKDSSIEQDLVALYAQADPVVAGKMDLLLGVKWKFMHDRSLNQAAKVKNLQKALGVPEPTDPRTQLEKLAREAREGAKSSADKSQALLEESARLTHASTLACALMQKEAGLARFEALFANAPKISKGQTTVKNGDPNQSGDDTPSTDTPTPMGKGVVPIGRVPTHFPGQLDVKSQRDPGRPDRFRNVHRVALKAGKNYAFYMVSAFDNYLILENSNGIALMQDDDSGGGLNALMRFTAPASGTYRVVATSCGSALGKYRLTVQEVAGFGMPAFGPGMGNPFFPRRKFFPPGFGPPGFGPPPFGPAGGAGAAMPAGEFDPADPLGQPKEQGPKAVGKKGPAGGTKVQQSDIAKLQDKNPSITRINAFSAIVAGLPADLTHNDVTARDAQAIARFLLTIKTKKELDDVLPDVAPLAKSRTMLLALADRVDQPDADQKSSATIVGALVRQAIQESKDGNWALRCRELLLIEALALPGKRKNAATETADHLRNLYKEQAILLGMPDTSFKDMTRTAQVMESVSDHMVGKLAKESLPKEDTDCLEQARRDLLVAKFIAQNDLELTVMLQRAWIKVLTVYLAQQSPQHATELRELQQRFSATSGQAANVFAQLRGGEENILALWMLAHDMK